MSSTGKRTWSNAAVILAAIALVPAFGGWLFPFVKSDLNSTAPSTLASAPIPPEALVEIETASPHRERLEGASVFINTKKVGVLNKGRMIIRVEPGAFALFINSNGQNSNILQVEASPGETSRLICFATDQIGDNVFCDFDSKPTLATIEIARESLFLGSSADMFVLLDGDEVGLLENGQSLLVKTEPGSKSLQIDTRSLSVSGRSKIVNLDLPPGALVRMRCRAKWGHRAECSRI